VLGLAHLIAGPVCGMYLADMGADVVKVEHPVDGEAGITPEELTHLKGLKVIA